MKEKTRLKLGYQFFAEENQTNRTTDAGLSAENKKYYDDRLIDMASAELVHDQFGQKRPIPQGNGKTIEFRKFDPLPKPTAPLTEGVTPEGKKLNVTTVEATVEQYGDYVELSDMLELTSIDNTVLEATKMLGRQAGLTLDTITRNKLQSGTVVFFAPKVAADGTKTDVLAREDLDDTCKLTIDLVKRVVAFLKANNAPKINGDYVAIIHPYVAYDVMSDPDWKAPHEYKDTTELYEGEIGKHSGVRFVETSEAKIYENGVFGCLFFGDGAYGTTEITGGGLETIIKQKGSAGTADPLNQRSTVGWKGTKTAEILVQPYLVRVECKSALSSKAQEN